MTISIQDIDDSIVEGDPLHPEHHEALAAAVKQLDTRTTDLEEAAPGGSVETTHVDYDPITGWPDERPAGKIVKAWSTNDAAAPRPPWFIIGANGGDCWIRAAGAVGAP